MKAKNLLPGTVFTIDHPDPESPVRVCLTNDKKHGIRFGWPHSKGYWCHMGEEVDVEVVGWKPELGGV